MSYQHYIFGKFITAKNSLSLKNMEEIFKKAQIAKTEIQKISIDYILEVLDRTAKIWSNPESKFYKTTLKLMPKVVGFSPEMIKFSLDILGDILSSKNLEKKISFELGNKYYLDRFIYKNSYAGYFRAQNLGIILHVSAGNIFLGGIDSLINGMLTKNVNLLKVASSDPLFPILFAQSLKEADPRGMLANNFCVLSFKGGEEKTENYLKKECDAIIVWGGEETVKSYRKNLPLKTKLIEYGPRIGFAVITQKGIKQNELSGLAQSIAKDIIVWDQKACSSPQVIYLEQNNNFIKLSKMLAEKLKQMAFDFPPGELILDEKIEITKFREMARADQAFGEAYLFCPKDSLNYSVVYEKDPSLKTSPLGRFIYIKPFKNIQALIKQLKDFSAYFQSLGICASAMEVKIFSEQLSQIGITRITEIGKMHQGKLGSPHEGSFQTQELIKWINIEEVKERFDILASTEEKEDSPESKFKKIKQFIQFAKSNSSYYGNILEKIKLNSLKDLNKIYLLDKQKLYENTPPQGSALLTGSMERAYVFSSGGTTGAPKFSFYTYEEFDEVIEILAQFFQIAGINKNDTVANLFMAGNLWSSFIVTNRAVERIGCVDLPIAGNADIELIVRYIKTLNPNALIGLPSILIQLAHYLEEQKLNISIEKILYAGEHLTKEAKEYLKEILGAKIIHSAGYASVDAGLIGYQCMEVSGGIHHLLSDYVYLEILDLKTQKPLKAGEKGEIVITNLKRKLMPLIRYRTGDFGRILKEKCSCGRSSLLFELLGRCDDIIRVGSVSLYFDEFSKILSAFSQLSHIFQLQAHKTGTKDALLIKIELKNQAETNNLILKEKIKEAILQNHQELKEAVEMEWLGELEIELLAPGGIPRVRRTGKIKKVLDLR
ncbi:MAG: hypothetical protein HYU63_04505 [Armatimonadetes bacterium]|nr:hypothetical protein [Armatimonadota bacterium]